MNLKPPSIMPGKWSDALAMNVTEYAGGAGADRLDLEKIAGRLKQLTELLNSVEKYDMHYPRHLDRVALKTNYREVETVFQASLNWTESGVSIQAQPDGTILATLKEHLILFEKSSEGKWVTADVPYIATLKESGERHVFLSFQASSPDRICLLQNDGRLILLNRATPRWVPSTLSSGIGMSSFICFQEISNERIVTGDQNGCVELWDLRQPDKRPTILYPPGDGESKINELYARGNRVFFSTSRGSLHAIDLTDPPRVTPICLELSPRYPNVYDLGAISDRMLVGRNDRNTVHLWKAQAGTEWARSDFHLSDDIACMQTLPDGRVAIGTFYHLFILDVRTGKVDKYPSNGSILSLHVVPDGRIYVKYNNGSISIWDGDLV